MRAADRPLGPFSEDTYVDFCVTEAVILKEMTSKRKAELAQRETQIREAWKADKISTEEAQRRIAELKG